MLYSSIYFKSYHSLINNIFRHFMCMLRLIYKRDFTNLNNILYNRPIHINWKFESYNYRIIISHSICLYILPEKPFHPAIIYTPWCNQYAYQLTLRRSTSFRVAVSPIADKASTYITSKYNVISMEYICQDHIHGLTQLRHVLFFPNVAKQDIIRNPLVSVDLFFRYCVC